MAAPKVLALVGTTVTEVTVGAGDAGVPTLVAEGETFAVPANKQALFSEEISLDGDLELDGVLVEVI